MKVKGSGTRNAVKSLVLAPFFSHKSSTSRPLLVSEVLARFGNVDIVTTNFDHQTKASKELFQFNDGRQIIYLSTMPYSHNVSPVRFFSHFIFSLSVWFFYLRRRNEYDVIYSTLPLNLISLLVFFVSPGKLKIVDVVDVWPDVLPFPLFVRKICKPFFSVWRKSFDLAVRYSDVLLAVSDRFLEESFPHFRSNEKSTRRFYIGAKRLPRMNRKIDQPLTMVYVGNIGRLYDFNTLLAALVACQNKIRLFIIGDGDRKDWLVQELERLNVDYCFFGVQYNDVKLSEILSQCHLGFNGYQNTTASFSYKANTYFSAGLPIVNTMSGDLESLVFDNGLGFNYQAGDVASLLTCIDSLSPEALGTLFENVECFFESQLEQNMIKDSLADFIEPFIVGMK